MWETQNDLLSFGDGDTAGNLETKPKVCVRLKFFFPVLQITTPDHLVKPVNLSFIVALNSGAPRA